MPKKVLTQELEGTRRRIRHRKRWKEEAERDVQVLGVRRWTELVVDRKKLEGHFSTGQSPQWAVVPMEGEELYSIIILMSQNISDTRFLQALDFLTGFAAVYLSN